DHACHRRGSSHGHTVAAAAGRTNLCFKYIEFSVVFYSLLFLDQPVERSGTDRFSTKSAIQHRATGHDERGKINATCTHHRRRRRFIASGQEHDTIQGICPNGFLDVHAGQIAKEHRGGSHDRLAKRGYRELKRETSGFSYTTLDKFSKVAQVTITRCELRPGITNANDGF